MCLTALEKAEGMLLFDILPSLTHTYRSVSNFSKEWRPLKCVVENTAWRDDMTHPISPHADIQTYTQATKNNPNIAGRRLDG